MTSILIADDHPFLRTGVEAVLRGSGYDVIASVTDGNSAWAAISDGNPDIAILDVQMPGMSGIELLARMREGGDNRAVVLLTAQIDDDQLVAAIRAGVNGIVLKEGAEERMIEVVRIVGSGGQAIPPELLARAVDRSREPVSLDPLAALTPRERSIAGAVALGLRNREIADRLGMTEGTVKVYLHRIYDKLGVDNRTSLAIVVRDHRLPGAN